MAFLILPGYRKAFLHNASPLALRPLSSVPIEMHELRTRTSTVPASTFGAGTSSMTTCPCLMSTCFNSSPPQRLFCFKGQSNGHQNPKQGGETSGKHIIKKVPDHKANDCQGNGHTEHHGFDRSKIRYSYAGKQLLNGAN